MRHVELERKFDIAPDAPRPSLEGVVEEGGTREHRLRAVYFDTLDLLLVRNGIVLRRREGGIDAGWHLKLPMAGDARMEVAAPLTENPGHLSVPEHLVREVIQFLGERWPQGAEGALLPVAVLRTIRQETPLLDTSGELVAELADDTVMALASGQVWRELELELAGGTVELLDRLGRLFADHGLSSSRAPSKLARAVGDRLQRQSEAVLPRKATAAEVVMDYLAQQVAVVVGREEDVRTDHADGVHKTRVATRRMRSTLRTFRRLFHREETDRLRDELKWYATVLGMPRDAEVMKDRISGAVEQMDVDLVVGPVQDRVRSELDGRHTRAHAALVEVLDGERYLALRDRLLQLLAEPPLRGRAAKRSATVLPRLVDKAIGRARTDWEGSRRAEGDERMHLLHEVRKRAKAVRYAFEALAPAVDGAARAAETWEEVTEQLGLLQDSQVAEEWLKHMAAAAESAGEPSRTYGTLIQREQDAARRQVAEGESVTVRAFELTGGSAS